MGIDISWVFSGIGTTILSLIVGAIGGGAIGYKIGINKNVTKQVQKSKSSGNQVQIGTQNIKK